MLSLLVKDSFIGSFLIIIKKFIPETHKLHVYHIIYRIMTKYSLVRAVTSTTVCIFISVTYVFIGSVTSVRWTKCEKANKTFIFTTVFRGEKKPFSFLFFCFWPCEIENKSLYFHEPFFGEKKNFFHTWSIVHRVSLGKIFRSWVPFPRSMVGGNTHSPGQFNLARIHSDGIPF